MADVKTFYPGATATNTINNATDAAIATTATIATTVDDQNAVANASVWTGTAVEYAAITPDANTLYFVI
tara:strand:+ start:2455 stop:2661 length:207 start_codon:yes stop_codon:yes gene_type:complete